jgi:hypothetical protein
MTRGVSEGKRLAPARCFVIGDCANRLVNNPKIVAGCIWQFSKNSRSRAASCLFSGFMLLSSLSFGAYGHPLPTSGFKYITLNHELRRVLGRAERDNFRNGITIARGDGTVVDPLQEIGEVPASPRVAVMLYRISLAERSLIAHNTLTLDLSPVLNL